MPSPSFIPIKLNQCLFGYDDGHRLLASSNRLNTEANSLLLLLSDLAPGLATTGFNGYWTGVPITSAKLYALMRTWPAPEMPRPGCVWTQALFISFADIARFADLQTVTSLFARPSAENGFENYGSALEFDPSMDAIDQGPTERSVQISDALRLVDALYSRSRQSNVPSSPGKLDAAIFGIWSQQWPRLRRSFSFRTAGGEHEPAPQNFRFDITAQTSSELRTSSHPTQSKVVGEPWKRVAAEDLCSPGLTDFRRFIWRYGSDVRHGRDRFRLLSEIYLDSRRMKYAYGELSSTLARVSAELPALDDGKLLKLDLVSERSAYSMLPVGDEIEKLEFFITHPGNKSLPTLPPAATGAIHDLWTDRAEQIIDIADRATASQSALGEALLDRLAAVAEPATFLAATRDRPALRHRLVSANPELIDSDEVLAIPQQERLSLAELVPEDAPFASRLLDRLTTLNDVQLAQSMLKRFPTHAMTSVATRVEHSATRGETPLPRAWAQGVEREASTFIELGLIEKARSTRVLAAFAALLGYTSDQVLRAGPTPWVAGLKNATDDIQGRERQMLLSFLLAIALARPAKGCETLFVAAFEPVHTSLWRSDLPYEAQSMLSPNLPNLYWWEQWDTCLRLRTATVDAFMNSDLDPTDFRRLTTDESLLELLLMIAGKSKNGRRLIKQSAA